MDEMTSEETSSGHKGPMNTDVLIDGFTNPGAIAAGKYT